MNHRVLVFDSNPTFLESLKSQLSKHKFITDASNSLADVQKMIQTQPYAFLVMDFEALTGDCAAQLKAIQKQCPKLPVVLFAARAQQWATQENLQPTGATTDAALTTAVSELRRTMEFWQTFAPKDTGITASTIMKSQLVSLVPTTRVKDAAETMHEKNIGAIAVIEQGTMVGLFTERDVVKGIACHKGEFLNKTLAEVMSKDIVFASPDTSIEQVEEIMRDKHIRHLPVFDNEKVVGIISVRDLNAARVAQGEEAGRAKSYGMRGIKNLMSKLVNKNRKAG